MDKHRQHIINKSENMNNRILSQDNKNTNQFF